MKGFNDFPLFSSGQVTLSGLKILGKSDFPFFPSGEVTLSGLII
jgi:hypothetical protein